MTRFPFLPVLALVVFPLSANTYSFEFTSQPIQCQDLSLKITGTGGNPPYQLVLVPSGPSPLPGDIEPRIVTVKNFTSNQDTLTFKLQYPGNSKFVAVVSDASGFGTGGTSVEIVVADSSDNSCYDSTKSAEAAYIFNINPPISLVQCQPTRIWWDKTKTQGATQFQGVIPAGQSFNIPIAPLSDVNFQGYGFNWTVNVRSSTPMFILAGDDRGLGAAGCADYTVSSGTQPVSDCINGNSPSVTAGDPAGPVRPTGSNTPSGKPNPQPEKSTAPIIGGVVGGTGTVVFVFIGVFLFRRRRQRRHPKKVNLFYGEDDDERVELPEHYEVQPFMATSENTTYSSSQRPPSVRAPSSDGHGGGFYYAASSAGGSGSGRKGSEPPQLRPTNIIQHEDAGPSRSPNLESESMETIELPPAYSHIRR